MESTCRSFGAEASRKRSVITSWSPTSRMTMFSAFLSAAACAPASASSSARSDADTWLESLGGYYPQASHEGYRPSVIANPAESPNRLSAVEMTLVDVLHHAVGNEAPQGQSPGHPRPAVGRGNRHRRDLNEARHVPGQVVIAEAETRPGHADEMGQVEELIGLLPRKDLVQHVRAGDEEELNLRPVLVLEVAQCVHCVRRTAPVDVDAAHVETGVARRRDHRHQVPVLGGTDRPGALLPRLAGRYKDDLV